MTDAFTDEDDKDELLPLSVARENYEYDTEGIENKHLHFEGMSVGVQRKMRKIPSYAITNNCDTNSRKERITSFLSLFLIVDYHDNSDGSIIAALSLGKFSTKDNQVVHCLQILRVFC